MPKATLRIAILALFAALCGCSPGGEPTAPPVELLARKPAVVVRDRGQIDPHPTRGWGPRAVGRWQEQTTAANDLHPAFVCALERRVGVRFTAAGKRDRTIVAPLALFFDNSPLADGTRPPPRPVRVLLNGVRIAEVEVGVAVEDHTISAPANAWLVGPNVVEFEIDELVTTPWGNQLGVAVGPLHVDAQHGVVVDIEARSLQLDSGTSVTYRVEQPVAATLDLAGMALVDGALRIAQRRYSTLDGASSNEGFPVELLEVGPDRPLATQIDLSGAMGDVLEIELAWYSENDAPIAIDRATLIPSEGIRLPPVIVIAIDTLAAEHLATYGYERETAPNISALARESVVFEQCTSNATWTVPSFLSIFSGMYPNVHEIEYDPATGHEPVQQWEQRRLAPNRWALAEALRSAGYQTAGFVDNTWISDQLGFAQGFDLWNDEAGFIPIEDRSGGIERVSRSALDWLDAPQIDRPYFLFLHAFDVHGPYVSKAPHRTEFAPLQSHDRQVRSGGVTQAYDIVAEYIARGEVDTGDLPETISSEALRASYDGGIHELDEKLGRLFTELRARGLYEEAVIVLLADHGETMGDGRYLFGHGVLDPEVTHVPLIVRLPKGRRGGQRVATPVQLVDVYPTVLDLVGLDHERDYLSGRSLRPAIEGWSDLEELPQYSFGGVIPNQRAVRLGRWRLRKSNPREAPLSAQLTHPLLPTSALRERFPALAERGMTPAIYEDILAKNGEEALWRFAHGYLPSEVVELYDVVADPRERIDLVSSRPDVVARLSALLESNLSWEVDMRALAESPRARPTLSSSAIEALRKLGYLEDEGGDH